MLLSPATLSFHRFLIASQSPSTILSIHFTSQRSSHGPHIFYGMRYELQEGAPPARRFQVNSWRQMGMRAERVEEGHRSLWRKKEAAERAPLAAISVASTQLCQSRCQARESGGASVSCVQRGCVTRAGAALLRATSKPARHVGLLLSGGGPGQWRGPSAAREAVARWGAAHREAAGPSPSRRARSVCTRA